MSAVPELSPPPPHALRARRAASRAAVRARPPAPARSGALDGLRGSAALAVLLFHVWLYRPSGLPGPRRALGDKVAFELNLGLICFFVLSGFLLFRPFARAALSGSRGFDLRGYALRRVARILPAYYACLVGSLLLYAAVGAGRLVPPPGQLATFFFFGQSYSSATLTAIDAVTWTLCVEVVFYLLLPLLGWAVIRLGPARVGAQVALLIALIAISAGWNAIAHLSGWGPVASKSLPAYVGDFSFGMLAALWVARTHGRRRAGGLALALSGAAVVAATGYWHERWGSHTLPHQILMDMPAAAGFALLVAALAAGRGVAPALFRARPLVGAGVISYGLYLWHIPLILVLIELGLLPASMVPRLVVVLGLTVAAAWLSWRLVERPVLRRVGASTPTRPSVDVRAPAL